MPALSITRPRQFTDLLRNYCVLIDGEHAVTIRSGQTVEIDLASGRHSAVAVIDWGYCQELWTTEF